MFGRLILVLLAISFAACETQVGDAPRQLLEYAPAPADNPLKGLVPYAPARRDGFPHSMEFGYVPLSALVVARGQYDWGTLDKLLDECAARGHQAVFRVYVEFPGRKDGIPAFLMQEGLKVFKYGDARARPPTESITPDYNDTRLRSELTDFIAALGKRYDGDPRIGFITAGLLGKWGEWHDSPRVELFASPEVQTEVMDAYETAFRTTRILLRYPIGTMSRDMAPNAGRPFGYHDDSFAWATLVTGRKAEQWFFMARMKKAGPLAMDKWKTQPIGGEIRPEAWGRVFDEQPGLLEVQDFRRCVEETHLTWVMDTGMFRNRQSPERWARAEEDVRRMGYEFHVPAVTIGPAVNGELPVVVELENRGVAPFYYDWPAEFALIADGKIAPTWKGAGKLTGLLPGDPLRKWHENLEVRGIKTGSYQLAMRVPNPLLSGKPVRFANKSQDADIPGWLTLGEFRAQ